MASLHDHVFAISGAGGSLGPFVARRLAAEGARLALTDIDREQLDAAVSALDLPEDRIDARSADLLDADACIAWADAVTERFGRIDGLLHLVGGWRGGEPIAEASLEDYEWLHDGLVRTTQHISQAFYEHLARGERGRFVIVSSTQAQSPAGTNAAYGAAKAAAESWTLALADSFREDGTGATANIIVIDALLTEQMRSDDEEHPGATPPEDIAEACLLLCSDRGSRINGGRLPLHR